MNGRALSMRAMSFAALAIAIPVAALAQPFAPMDVNDKLNYQIKRSFGPVAMLGDLAYAGILQEADTPTEWGQGGSGYGKRFASTVA